MSMKHLFIDKSGVSITQNVYETISHRQIEVRTKAKCP
jgi:hypothetical protein